MSIWDSLAGYVESWWGVEVSNLCAKFDSSKFDSIENILFILFFEGKELPEGAVPRSFAVVFTSDPSLPRELMFLKDLSEILVSLCIGAAAPP